MYISFDYRCSFCEHVESRFVKRTEMDEQTCSHGELPSWYPPTLMVRLPAATRTTFRHADTKLKE